MKRKIYILIVVVILINYVNVFSNINTKKNYVPIGDSISAGLGATEGNDYATLFYEYLKENEKNLEMNNHGIPGQESGELIQMLNNDSYYINSVKNAKIITITVGGNDILNPTIEMLCKQYSVDYLDVDVYQKVFEQVRQNPIVGFEILQSEEYRTIMENSIENFNKNLKVINSRLIELSPEAKIYIYTIYNPFYALDILFNLFDPYFQKINKVIKSTENQIDVIDIYEELSKVNDLPMVNFDLMNNQMDIHPSDNGHMLMFEKLKEVYIEDKGEIFTDLKNHWSKEYVVNLYDLGLINGYGNKRFKPDNYITRGEAVVVLSKMLKLKKETDFLFKDDKNIPSWAKKYVYLAVEKGIVKGFDDGEFKANRNISRAESAVIISRCIDNKEFADDSTKFADYDIIPKWASGYVKRAVDEKIILGYKDNTFRAANSITRAEFSVLVSKLRDKL